MGDMISNSFITPIPVKILHFFPAAMNHTLAFFSYAHRIHRGELQYDRPSQMKAWTRVYHHRGLVIQELKEMIARDATGGSDVTILVINQLLVTEILVLYPLCPISMLLLTDYAYQVLQSGSRLWRDHAAWLVKLIQFRGGYLKLFHSSPVFPASLSLFIG